MPLQAVEVVTDDAGKTLQRGQWGRWKLDRQLLTLQHTGWRDYEIDLERVRDGIELLDWIFWAGGKVPETVQPGDETRMTRQDVGDLVEAFDFLFENAWREGKIEPKKFLLARFEEIESAAARSNG